MNFARFLVQESKHLYNTDIKSVLTWVYDLCVKAERLKRPRESRPYVRPYKSQFARYGYDELHMAFLSKDRGLISQPTNCRDYFNEVIRWYATGGKTRSLHCDSIYDGMFDYDNLRMVLLYDVDKEEVFSKIKNGLRVADMYGRVAGWKKFRLVRCLIPSDEREENPPKEAYIVIGDRNWQRAPQFISMLMLLIRVCLYHEVPSWIQDAYALQGHWHEILKGNINKIRNDDFNCFLVYSYDKLLTIVANEREIFPHDQDENFHMNLDNFHLRSGLDSLIRHENTTHPESATKLKRLHQEVITHAGRTK